MEMATNIKSKVYYDQTGAVLLITSEQHQGAKTTIQEDIQYQEALKNKSIDDISFIELEFGTLSATIENSKSYNVDIATKKLNVIYYTQAEIDEINNNIPLSAEQLLEQDNANLLLELVQKDILINQLQGGV